MDDILSVTDRRPHLTGALAMETNGSLIGKVALVTGSSRGIGAATAVLLAKTGADVVVNCRVRGSYAKKVAGEIRALGRRALAVQADLTDENQIFQMFNAIRDTFGRLDILILNASGGLELNMPADYPMRLNRDAQVQAVALALPLMPVGGRIVFVTSHYAHFYPEMPFPPEYEPVAASKNAGEAALRDRIPALADRDVTLVVISGDIVKGTLAATIVEYGYPNFLAEREEKAGVTLPTVDEFAAAVVDAALAPHSSGDTIVVGGPQPN
jgi:NAD(P)-dependent dehydrogenase (short-subunit alcohol dehydrogenase family)